MSKEVFYASSILIYIKKLFDNIFFNEKLNFYFLRPLVLNVSNINFEYVLHRTENEKKVWLSQTLGFSTKEVEVFLNLYKIYGDYDIESDYLNRGILYIDVCLDTEIKEESLYYSGFGVYQDNYFILHLNNKFNINITRLSLYCDLFIFGYDLMLDYNINLYIVSNKYKINGLSNYSLFSNFHIELDEDLSSYFLKQYKLCYLTNVEDLLRCNLNKFSKIIINTEDINIGELFKKYQVSLDNKTIIFYCNYCNFSESISIVNNYLRNLTLNNFLNIEIYGCNNSKTFDYIDRGVINNFGKCLLHTPSSNILIKG